VSNLRLSIDLGTSHTVAVVRRGDEAPRPLLFDGSPVLPSAIFSQPPRLHVGRDAERMALIDPSRFEPHPKRRVDEGSVLLGNTEVTVVDMFVALLRRVAAEAAQAGVPLGGGAVLTCPADWGAHRRGALTAAAGAAGLGAVQLVDEPVAAATYCLDVLRHQVPVGGTVAVFDFGGGTLDVSVLRREPGGLRVLSVGGLDDLGGVDVDAALVGHLGQLIGLRSPRVWQRITNPGPQSEQRERRQFWDDVRAAKEMLSRASSAPVHVPGMDSALHLTRDELERIAGPLIDRAVDETRRVVRASGVEPATLAGLFLVGGSSRIPLVASRLHARFGIGPTVPEQPELPVAYGGLIAAGGASAAAGAAVGAAPRAPAPPVPQQGRPPMAGSPPAMAGAPAPHAAPPGVPAPPNAPHSAPPGTPHSGAPHSAPPGPHGLRAPAHSPSVPVSGFPISSPPGSYAPGSYGPGSGGPSPGSPTNGPPSYPPFSASGTLPPVAPPMPPPGGPPPMGPRPRRRRGKVRYIVLGVVIVLLAACGGTGVWAYNALRGAFDNAANGTNGSNAEAGEAGEAGELKQAGTVQVPGAGALTVLAGRDVAYYAAVADGALTVAAHGTDGTEKWNKTYAVEPTGVRIQATGNLLVVEAEKAATHAGRNVRLVLDAATGEQKQLDPAADPQRVVAYLGGDVVVENGPSSKQATLQRIDLATGTARWTVKTAQSSILDPKYTRTTIVHAPNGPTGSQGIPVAIRDIGDGATVADWQEPLAADGAAFVYLDESAGKGTAWDGNGKVKVNSGALPIRSQHWAIYAGTVIGQLNEKTSPGRVTIAGFAVENFAKRWEFPLAAGASVSDVKPCGPTHACVLFNLNGTYSIKSIDLSTGKQTWPGDMTTTSSPNWYLLGSGLLFGESRFGGLAKPELRDVATAASVRALGSGRTTDYGVAANGRWMVMNGVRFSGGRSTYTVAAVDVTTGKMTSTLDIGPINASIVNASVTGDLLVAVGKNRNMVIGRLPAAK
jgi:outer membrane protein assembly factor BamB/Ethanolamine utilization protein EutJ (predicted chaperonin)